MRLKSIFTFLFIVTAYFCFAQVMAGPEVSVFSQFKASFLGYGAYVWNEITFNVSPWYINYFWLLILLSLVVWLLEILFPWRKNQNIIRKDFWLDLFYLFFNFFLFRWIVFDAVSIITEREFQAVIGSNLSDYSLINLSTLHPIFQFIIFFVALDFIQWFTHFLLHRFNFLWRFHQIHHSVEEMGFAAHMRYHWMENVIYTPMKYIAMLLIGGFHVETAFIAHYFSIAIGHMNHANINVSYGPLKYVFNNPRMHLWHHAYDLPQDHQYGANFGISLSIWDYIFRTNYQPYDDPELKLGFNSMERVPKTFFGQFFYGFRNRIKKNTPL